MHPTFIAAILYLIPNPLPLLPPREWPAAGEAGFLGKVLLFDTHHEITWREVLQNTGPLPKCDSSSKCDSAWALQAINPRGRAQCGLKAPPRTFYAPGCPHGERWRILLVMQSASWLEWKMLTKALTTLRADL